LLKKIGNRGRINSSEVESGSERIPRGVPRGDAGE
jgi:hypothetical protein